MSYRRVGALLPGPTPGDSGRMRTRTALLALGALAATATAGTVAARAVDPVHAGPPPAAAAVVAPPSAALDAPGAQAPAVEASGWLNSPPLTPAGLAGKVVLYDFWTFGCVNCLHTLPHVKAWHARYAADGLVIVSIHTPEFPAEADPANVTRFVQENGIRYPVALDPGGRVWAAFGNRYWPQFSLHDRQGRHRLTAIGEGGYDRTEDGIRALLGVPAGSPRARLT